MSEINEKSAVVITEHDASPNVLTITRPSPARSTSSQGVDVLSIIDDNESSHSLTPTHTQHNEKLSSDRAPFYAETMNSESKQNINVHSTTYDTDIEACISQAPTQGGSSRTVGGGLLKNKSKNDIECSVWPGQQQLKRKKKMMRKERGKHNLCGCMAGMPKRTQMWIKLAIACLVVGAAIGIGIGVSKAVGGGIWKSQSNTNSPIQGSSR